MTRRVWYRDLIWVRIAALWGVGLGLVSSAPDPDPMAAVGFAFVGAAVWHAALLICSPRKDGPE